LAKARVLRVIARMNLGGPAYNVALLSGRLNRNRFETLLVHGVVGPGEGSLDALARREGCRVEVIEELSPEMQPRSDLRALIKLIRIIRRFRPDIVHTHTAKAGFLGRIAAVLGQRPRPIVVHTYHGHVLEGYFGGVISRLYREVERRLTGISDCLVGVSQATVTDLVRLGVAPSSRFRVIPVGLDLERFSEVAAERGFAVRRLVNAGPDDVLLAFVGRLVPIKRVDLLLRAVASANARTSVCIRLAIVGDGELRDELEEQAARLEVEESVTFMGYIEDVTDVATGADVAVLSSDNEGTPVALIEAAAAGKPAVTTAVGGVPDVVIAERTGLLVPAGDAEAHASALVRLAEDAGLRSRMGAAAREHVLSRFTSDRLVAEIEGLYEGLLGSRSGRRSPFSERSSA
jgi:glycosyltransferase involved in cell wall biosynthesis